MKVFMSYHMCMSTQKLPAAVSRHANSCQDRDIFLSEESKQETKSENNLKNQDIGLCALL